MDQRFWLQMMHQKREHWVCHVRGTKNPVPAFVYMQKKDESSETSQTLHFELMYLKCQVSSWTYRFWYFTNESSSRQSNSFRLVEYEGDNVQGLRGRKGGLNDVITLLQLNIRFSQNLSLNTPCESILFHFQIHIEEFRTQHTIH